MSVNWPANLKLCTFLLQYIAEHILRCSNNLLRRETSLFVQYACRRTSGVIVTELNFESARIETYYPPTPTYCHRPPTNYLTLSFVSHNKV